MTRDEKIRRLRDAERLLGAVLRESDGDTAKAIDGAIRRAKLARFLLERPGCLPIVVRARESDALRPHDV